MIKRKREKARLEKSLSSEFFQASKPWWTKLTRVWDLEGQKLAKSQSCLRKLFPIKNIFGVGPKRKIWMQNIRQKKCLWLDNRWNHLNFLRSFAKKSFIVENSWNASNSAQNVMNNLKNVWVMFSSEFGRMQCRIK